MKKIVILFVFAVSIISCKNETKTEETTTTVVTDKESNTETLKTIEGEFLFVDGAGVLMGKNFIYGVTLDEMTETLIKQAASKQRDKFDMVPVIIKGEVNPKPQGSDVWEEIVTIKEIIKVLEPKGEAPIKIETGK